MSADKPIPFPDTFKPLGAAASKVLDRLQATRAEAAKDPLAQTAASLNRFAESQKGKTS